MRLVYLTLGWVAGIVLASSFETMPASAWLVLSLVFLAALVLVLPRRGYRLVAAAVLALALGGWRFSIVPQSSPITVYNNAGGLTVHGVVIEEPDIRDDRIQARVDVDTVTFASESHAVGGLALVQAPRTVDFHYGDRIAATGLLITPAEFDTFSYADYLARSGVFSVMPYAAVEVVETGHGSPLLRALFDLKADAARAIARYLPEPNAALLSGILLGSERGIAPEIQEAFSRVGASHIVAISGFNMVIISGVVMGLLGRFVRRKWLAALCGIGVIAVYTIFVGANAAVVRAAIMSGLLAVAPVLKRKTYVPASLAFVALVMSALNPKVLWDVSFQLSFFATLGLTLFVEPLTGYFDRFLQRILPYDTATSVGGFLAEPLIVTLAAQITTLPLIVMYFGRLSLLSIFVNLLIIPVQTPLLILGGLATLAVFAVPLVAQALYWFDLILLGWTIGVVRALAALPFADVEFYVDPRLVLLFFVLLLGGALMQAAQPRWWRYLGRLVRRRTVVTATLFAGGAVVILTWAIFLSRPDRRLHVWLLDVGHSNAVLLQSPGGAQVLIDGGRFPSRLLTAIGDRLPFNDREIEVLVITQPDEFDFGALPAVLARYDIGVALTNGQPNLGEAYAELEAALAQHEVVVVRAGYTLDFDDGLKIEVLHPQRQPDLGDSLNDYALVLRVTYGDISFLLTSDLSKDGESALLDAGQWPLASVMQIPQHGTTGTLDTRFLDAVQPQAAVLQVDRANRRGDPDPDTLTLLGDLPVFRTDMGGALHLWTDGQELWAVQQRVQ